MRKFLRIFLRVLAVIFLILVLILLFLNTPPGRNFIRKQAEQFLREKLQTTVVIGKLDYVLPQRISLGDVLLLDREQDTLLAAGSLSVKVRMLALLRNKLDIREVSLEAIQAHIYRKREDTVFNFNYIIEAFSGEEATPSPEEKDTAASGLEIVLKQLRLRDIRFRFDDYAGGSLFGLQLDTLDLSLKTVDLSNLLFEADGLLVAGLAADFIQDTSFLPVVADTIAQENTALGLAAENIELRRIRYTQQSRTDGFYMDVQAGKLLASPERIDLAGQEIAVKDLLLQNTSVTIQSDSRRQAPEEKEPAIPVVEEDAAMPWRILAGNIRLENIGFRMDDLGAARQKQGIDYAHLAVEGLSLHAQQIFFTTADTIAGIVKHLSCKEKNSGFHLEELKTHFAYHPQGAVLRQLYLKTPHTLLQDQLEISYKDLQSASNRPGTVRLNIQLKNSIAGMGDLLLFAPQLASQDFFRKNRTGRILLDTRISGTLASLNLEHVHISVPGNTFIKLKGTISGLPETEALRYALDVEEISTGRTDLNVFLPPSVSRTVRLPDRIRLRGRIAGNMEEYRPHLFVNTTDGDLSLQGFASLKKGKEAYEIALLTRRLDLAAILMDTSLGPVTLSVHATGQGIEPETMDAALHIGIRQAVYNRYAYRDITLEALAAHGIADIKMVSPDTNADIKLAATVDFRKEYPALKGQIQVDSVDLKELRFTEGEMRLRTTVALDFPELNPDYPRGHVYLAGSSVAIQGRNFFPDSFKIISAPVRDRNDILIEAGPLTGRISGGIPLTKTGTLVSAHFQKYYPLGDSAAISLASDTAAYALRPQDTLSVQAILVKTPLLTAFLPELTGLDTVRISAFAGPEALKFQTDIPQVTYGSNNISKGYLLAEGRGSRLTFNAGMQNLRSGKINLWYTNLNGQVSGGTVDAAVRLADADSATQFAIAAKIFQQQRAQVVQLKKGLVMDYDPWEVNENNRIVFSDSGFYVQDFLIRNGREQLQMNSIAPNSSSPIEMAIQNFDLVHLTNVISGDTLIAAGILNGKVTLQKRDSVPEVEADLKISRLAVFDDTLGDLSVKVKNEPGYMDVSALLAGNGNRIDLNGKYYLSPVAGQNFDMKFSLSPLNIKSLESFTDYQIRNSSGSIEGTLYITGNTTKPVITGSLKTRKISTNVAMLNSRFSLPDEEIRFNEEGISFRNFTIEDSSGNKAHISGKIDTRSFSNIGLDLRLRTNQWQAMHSTAKDNKEFYGDLFLTTNIQVKGTVTSPDVEGKIDILKGTDVTIAIPETQVGIQEREGIVEFVNVSSPEKYVKLSRQKDTLTEASITPPAGSEINLNITLDESATFSVIIDQSTGDFLKVKGKADLNTTIAPDGTVGLAGTYEIIDGSYQLNYNMIRRNFRIRSGSTIVFSGEPTDAETDITAVYEANVAPYDLVEKQIADPVQLVYYKQRLPFDVQMKLKGPLMKPQINFDIVLPESKTYRASSEVIDVVKGKLVDLRNNPSELNKQVFALIILNRFVAENPFESGAGGGIEGMARQSASRFISEQLNKFADGLIEGLELTMDLETSEDYTTGSKRNRTDLNIGASKNINDRLTVFVGNTFQLEGTKNTSSQASSLIPGNLTLDYDFTADKRYRMRVYRRNEEVGVRGFVVKTGASFIYTVNYNRFNELFVNRKKKREIRQEQRKQRTTDSTGSERTMKNP